MFTSCNFVRVLCRVLFEGHSSFEKKLLTRLTI